MAAILLAAASFVVAIRHMSHSIWVDEYQTLSIAQKPSVLDVARAAMRERPYPPLFFLAVHYCLRFRDDEAGLRVSAAIFGALAILGVFFLGRTLADDFTGLIAALLFVLTPGAFRYFVDGNAYTLLILVSAFSTLYLVRAVRSDRWTDWTAYVLFAFLGLATHVLFLFYFGAQLLGGLYLMRTGARGAVRKRFAAAMSSLVVLSILGIGFYLGHGGMRLEANVSGLLTLNAAVKTAIGLAGMYAGPESAGYPVQAAAWGLLQVLGAATLFFQRRAVFWFLAAVVILPVAAVTLFVKATTGYVAYKYGLGTLPIACIVAACPLTFLRGKNVPEVPWRSALRVGIFAAIAVYAVAGGVFIAKANPGIFEFQDWRGAARYLGAHAGRGDTVIARGLMPLNYYYKGPASFIDTAEPGRSQDLVASVLNESGPPGQKAWIVMVTYENDNPLIGKFTNVPAESFEAQTQQLLSELRERKLFADAVRFHRVNVVVASRTPLRGN